MKKFTIIVLALITALILTEFFVAEIINYPTFGVEKKVKISGKQSYQNLFKPYSEYWNVEGGNKVFKRNNLGIPGTDVLLSEDLKNIMVLGSSFIEAYQIEPDKIATSVFQKRIQKESSKYNVVNLGASGHDVYDSWIRLKYFEQQIKPDYIILVVQSTYEKWLSRQKKPLNFSPEYLGKEKINKLNKYNLLIRNKSHFVSLLAQSLKQIKGKLILQDKAQIEDQTVENVLTEMKITNEFIETILEFKKEYKDKFALISIINDEEVNIKLEDICKENEIVFNMKSLIKQEFMLHGAGHLNAKGNKMLGEFLYESFIENYQEK
jgi:hypothetical protein